MTRWFGTSWGAPLCDPAQQIAVPVGDPCLWCHEAVAADDSGVAMPSVQATETTVAYYHLECFMRTVVGSVAHQLGLCACVGGTEDCEPPLHTKRQHARLACVIAQTLDTVAETVALDTCAVCGKTLGYGIRALHVGRCEDHPETPS